MSKLRRIPAITWVIVVLVSLAMLPLGAVPGVARYVLVGYVPGLAIWKHLRTSASSIVDIVFYPSLLSILPFAWIALASVALGFDLRISGVVVVAIFLIVGFSLGWSRKLEKVKGDVAALALSATLVVFLLVIPFAANSFQAVAWDAPLHAAIVSRIQAGVIPPDSPMVAGQPVNYYWLYHFYSSVLMRITGFSVYQVFAILNVHAFVLFALAGYRIASQLTENLFGRISAVWILVFGLNAFGWIIFFASGSVSPDKWYSLVVPLAMVKDYSPSLGSLIHEFLDGSPFPVSFAFDMAWLGFLLARINGERGGTLIAGGLILATIFYLHPLSAVFVIASSCAAVGLLLLVNRRNQREGVAVVVDLAAVTAAAALVTVPYAWDILHGRTGTPLSMVLTFAYLKSQGYAMLATVGLVGIAALPGLWLGFRKDQRAAIVLAFFAGATAIAALTTHVALDAQYKLTYLLAFGLAPLVAIGWNFWRRQLVTRVVFILALAISAPTNALTSYCFTTQPPLERRDPMRLRLLEWIRDQTPENAILVEFPSWTKYQTTGAESLYVDRFRFDIGVYAKRRQLVCYGAALLEQWGYRDLELRQALAFKLTTGQALAPDNISYLARLRAPIVVVTDVAVVGSDGFDPATYSRIYEDGDLRAYRVLLPDE